MCETLQLAHCARIVQLTQTDEIGCATLALTFSSGAKTRLAQSLVKNDGSIAGEQHSILREESNGTGEHSSLDVSSDFR